jgi:hypothetical protein
MENSLSKFFHKFIDIEIKLFADPFSWLFKGDEKAQTNRQYRKCIADNRWKKYQKKCVKIFYETVCSTWKTHFRNYTIFCKNVFYEWWDVQWATSS